MQLFLQLTFKFKATGVVPLQSPYTVTSKFDSLNDLDLALLKCVILVTGFFLSLTLLFNFKLNEDMVTWVILSSRFLSSYIHMKLTTV